MPEEQIRRTKPIEYLLYAICAITLFATPHIVHNAFKPFYTGTIDVPGVSRVVVSPNRELEVYGSMPQKGNKVEVYSDHGKHFRIVDRNGNYRHDEGDRIEGETNGADITQILSATEERVLQNAS